MFGSIGTGRTIPSASIPYAQPRSSGGTSAMAFGAITPTPPTFIPLTDDLINPPTTTGKKKTTGTA